MFDSILFIIMTFRLRFYRKNVMILSLCAQRCYGHHKVS